MSHARPAIISLSFALLAASGSAQPQEANLARGAQARQSSVDWGGEPSRAVDGNRDGNWGAGSVTHTAGEANAWLELDLGEAKSIASVVVYNRTDCCSERLNKVSVEVSEGPCDAAPKVLGSLPLSATGDAVSARTQLDFPRAPRARYVCLRQPVAAPLSVAEVEVLPGTTAPAPTAPAPAAPAPTEATNLARGARARQSSTVLGAEAARAIDGNRDSNWGGGSVTHSAGEANAWLELDLAEATSIASVVVYNRTDCCAERLNKVSVELSEGPCDGAPKVLVSRPLSPTGGALAAKTQLDFPGAPRARYVCLRQPVALPLSVAEVEVLSGTAPGPSTAPSTPAPLERWTGCLPPPPKPKTEDGTDTLVTDTRYLWRVGQTLRYCFLPNVPTGWRNHIETTAREWLKYANLNFDFSTDCERADYRIGADPTQVSSWSCLGTGRPCSTNGAEMNFLVDERGTILHEFGHSIGLIHEHKSPLFSVPWDRERVFAEMRADGNNWTDERIQAQVMDTVSGATIRASIFDPDSIMIYGINPNWVVGGAATLRKLYPNLRPNYSPSELSAADRLYIGMLYPPAGTPRSFAFAAAAPSTLVRKFGVFDGTTSTETEVVMQGWSIRSLFGGDSVTFQGPLVYAVLADGQVGYVSGTTTGVSPPVGRAPFSPAETVFGSDGSRTYVATADRLQVMSARLMGIPLAVRFEEIQTFPTGLGPFTQACASRGDIFTLDAAGSLRRFRDLAYDGGELALSPPKGEVVATGVSARAIACSDGKVFGFGVGDTAWVATPGETGYVVRTTGAASRYLRGLAVGGGGFAYAISDPPGTTVWKDSKFRGESWTIFSDQPQLGRWNDEISAIRVDPRSAVALYKDSFFRGQCLTVRGEVAQLSKTPMGNDAVSSLKLDATCEGPYTGALPAAVFTDSDGRSIEVYGDIPNLKARAFNDSIARILINPGTSLSMYKDKNYTGVCRRMQVPRNGLTITVSGPTIQSFGREVTAIRLGSDPNCARVDL